MSNIYPFGVSAAFGGGINIASDTIQAVLVMTGAAGYQYNSGHSALSNVSAYARASNGIGTLGTKAFNASGSAFTLDAADTTLTSVTGAASGAVFHAYLICKSAAAGENQSWLISYNELTAPITANGGNITLQHNANGLGRIWTDS